jgi:hypothetical protein
MSNKDISILIGEVKLKLVSEVKLRGLEVLMMAFMVYSTAPSHIPNSWNEITRDMYHDLHTVTGKFDERWLKNNGGVSYAANLGEIVIEHQGQLYRFRKVLADQYIRMNDA